MAKVPFTKLSLKKKDDIKIVNINGQDIEVKQYLPINDKTDLISRIANECVENNNHYINGIKLDVIADLEIIMTYTNITFTDKQKEDTGKLYDLLTENGISKLIFEAIPNDEVEYIKDNAYDILETLYEYNNSAAGILEMLSKNYDNLNFDTTSMQKSLKDPENLALLKDVLTKLG